MSPIKVDYPSGGDSIGPYKPKYGAELYKGFMALYQEMAVEQVQQFGIDQMDGMIVRAVVLCTLSGHSCSVTEIAETTHIPQQTVSRRVANLIEKGWIEEQKGPGKSKLLTSYGSPDGNDSRFLDLYIDRMRELLNAFDEQSL